MTANRIMSTLAFCALAVASITRTLADPVPVAASGPLLDIIRAMPDGSWQRVNANRFDSVWPADELRPMVFGGVSVPQKIISAWSGFAWDSRRGDLIIYGGGHGNYPGNDVYRLHSSNLLWERAALAS